MAISVLLLTFLGAARAYAADDAGPIRFQTGPVTLEPAGFFQPVGMVRGATTGDTINTRFGRIPLDDSPEEALFSAAHSRLMLHASAPFGEIRSMVYLETDFLNPPGEQPFRVRQIFGQIQYGKWKLLGGKGWSMLRPNRVGMLSDKDLMHTHVVEPNYHVGIVGLRREQIRLQRDDGRWQTAIAYESGGRWVAKAGHDGVRARLETSILAGTRGRKGASLAGVIHAGPKVNVVSQQFWSQGAGQDILNLLPLGVHAHSTLQGVEAQVRKSLELFGYGGIVYGGRSASNRVVRQWTGGFRRRLIADPVWGSVFLAGQYSQVDRAVWAGGHGDMNYAMLSLWFYVPGAR